MSPTPVTFQSPAAPSTYSWEATDEEVAARYGVDPATIVRFDLNTSPTPPGLVADLLAAGRFEAPLSEYPPTDYRRLVEAAAARYGVTPAEIIVGAGADEILDIAAKVFIPAGGRAVVPVPTYAMYRVLTEQRRATVVAVPRLGRDAGLCARPAGDADRGRRTRCGPRLALQPEQPDGPRRARRHRSRRCCAELDDDAAAAGRQAPVVVLDEAYAEFVGSSLLALRDVYPNLIVVRTASKAYALAGLRVGFGVARPEMIARLNPFRPPGSVSTVSVTLVTEALRDPEILQANLERVVRERARLTDALRAIGWRVEPSVTNFILVGFGSPERAGAVAERLMSRGLVPRTFGAGHPLADHLRLTVRNADENDRLIAAAEAAEAEAAAPEAADRAPAPPPTAEYHQEASR